MVAANPREIARIVQERLRGGGPCASRVRVLADEVTPGTDGSGWWYVPVSVHRDVENMAVIYEAFSQIEEDLERSEHVSVLLVPRIIPFQRWSESA